MSKHRRPDPLLRAYDLCLLHLAALAILLRNWYATGLYWYNHHKLPRIAVPQTFNDKIFWRKIVDRNPLFVLFNDKVKVRDWIADTTPQVPLARLLWHGPDPRDIPDDVLAGPAMIKANHGCGWNLPYDGQTPDRAEIEATLNRWLGSVFGKDLSEWAYARIPPQGLIEERLFCEGGAKPHNYNFHCSDGEILWVGIFFSDGSGQRKLGYFDAGGARLPLKMNSVMGEMDASFRPAAPFETAARASRVLSKGVDYVRCDFMVTGDQLWFNEMTTYSGSGHIKFSDPGFIGRLQDGWDLRKSWFLTTPQAGLRNLYRKALLRELDRRAAT